MREQCTARSRNKVRHNPRKEIKRSLRHKLWLKYVVVTKSPLSKIKEVGIIFLSARVSGSKIGCECVGLGDGGMGG